MTIPTTAELLKYADLQMAAEAFLKNEKTNEEFYSSPDVLRFGNNIDTGTAIVARSSNDLLLTFQYAADSVTVQNYFAQNDASSYALAGC